MHPAIALIVHDDDVRLHGAKVDVAADRFHHNIAIIITMIINITMIITILLSATSHIVSDAADDPRRRRESHSAANSTIKAITITITIIINININININISISSTTSIAWTVRETCCCCAVRSRGSEGTARAIRSQSRKV